MALGSTKQICSMGFASKLTSQVVSEVNLLDWGVCAFTVDRQTDNNNNVQCDNFKDSDNGNSHPMFACLMTIIN